MPKITHQRIHRLHISLFEQQYEKLRQLAARSNTSISFLLRREIYELIKKEDELNQKLIESETEFNKKINSPTTWKDLGIESKLSHQGSSIINE